MSMCGKSDIFNMDDMMDSLNEKAAILDCAVQIDALFEILKQRKIADDRVIAASMEYVKAKPEYQVLKKALEHAYARAKDYKSKPEKHLQDLFEAKMKGQI